MENSLHIIEILLIYVFHLKRVDCRINAVFIEKLVELTVRLILGVPERFFHEFDVFIHELSHMILNFDD